MASAPFNPDPPGEAELVDAMLRGIRGFALDLSGMDGSLANMLAFLPVQGWQAIEDHVDADGAEICRVDLPDAFAQVFDPAPVIAGLGRFTGLESLGLPAPAGDNSIDLGALRLKGAAEVWLRCRPHRFLTVTVRQGIRVCALPQEALPGNDLATRKSWVVYVDADGRETGERRTLAGMVYDRKGQGIPRDLNGLARFPADDKGPHAGRSIDCRHLALQWLHDRKAHARARVAGAVRFSYAAYENADLIAERVSAGREAEYQALVHRGASTWVDDASFGAAIAEELAASPGAQAVHLTLMSPNHVMAVELLVKPPRRAHPRALPAYIVNFYDPSRTTTHRRVVFHDLARLRQATMKRFLAPERMKGLFDPEGPFIALLHRLPQDEAAAVAGQEEFDRHLPPQGRISPQFLHAALVDGRSGAVQRSIDAMLTSLHLKSELMTALAARANSSSGLTKAMAAGQVDAVGAYVRSVANAGKLSLGDRAQLLAAGMGPGLALHGACLNSGWNHCEPGLRLRREHAIREYVRGILCSSLEIRLKRMLCASINPRTRQTAAAAALGSGKAGVAAAVVCAGFDIWEKAEERARWLKLLRVNLEELGKALDGNSQPSQWISELGLSGRPSPLV